MQQDNQVDIFNEMSLDETAKQTIRSIASWAMTVVAVAVIGYVITILDLIMGQSRQATSSSELFDFKSLGVTGGDAISTIVVVLIGLLINYFLFRFATLAKNGVNGLNQQQLNSSFKNLKNYFLVTSILLVVMFVLVLLAVGVGASQRGTF